MVKVCKYKITRRITPECCHQSPKNVTIKKTSEDFGKITQKNVFLINFRMFCINQGSLLRTEQICAIHFIKTNANRL